MNWLVKMRKSQRMIAERFGNLFIGKLFENSPVSGDFKCSLKENVAIETAEILELMSWIIAEKIFNSPNSGWKKNAEAALKEARLDFDLEGFLQEMIKPDDGPRNNSFRAVETAIVTGFFEWLITSECNLPGIGKLTRKNGDIFIVLDRRGLQKIKKLFDEEEKQEREAAERAGNKPMPGGKRLNITPFDDK